MRTRPKTELAQILENQDIVLFFKKLHLNSSSLRNKRQFDKDDEDEFMKYRAQYIISPTSAREIGYLQAMTRC